MLLHYGGLTTHGPWEGSNTSALVAHRAFRVRDPIRPMWARKLLAVIYFGTIKKVPKS
jgi:hypothetical protein